MRSEMRALGVFVINFALPSLLFKSMAERSIADLANLDLLLIYALGSTILAIGVLTVTFWTGKRSLQSGCVLAMGMTLSNSAFIGFPVALQVLGPKASMMLAIYAAVENLIVMPLLMVLAEAGDKTHASWVKVLFTVFGRLLTNPLILSILLGIAFSASQLILPVPLGRSIDMLSNASAPVALFYIGGVLAGQHLKGMVKQIGVIVFGKLLLHPLAVSAAFLLIPFDNPELKMAAIINAGMPMASIYPILGHKYGYEGMCAAALVVTTTISFFTISGLLWLMGAG